MKLVDLKLKEYLDVLLSDAPAPGGGSVSALAGAQGAALLAMVCGLTLGKKKYAEEQELCQEIKDEATKLYVDFSEAIDKDTEAFNMVAAAFKLPKETEAEKAARREAIAAGTLESTKVPFGVMKTAAAALDLAQRLHGHYNTNCASDFGVGVQNLITCMRGAWMNVRINLPGLKDEAYAQLCEKEGGEMIAKYEELAERLYQETAETL